MLVHTVVFWLKKGVPAAGRARFRKALEGLAAIKSARRLFVGVPAATAERGVIDRSYDLSLTAVFKDVAALAAYDVHPIHARLLADFAASWKKVVVYDAE